MAVDTAAALVAISEDAQARRLAGDDGVSVDDAIRAASAARRAVRDLGIGKARKPDAPSLADYLARDAAPPESAA